MAKSYRHIPKPEFQMRDDRATHIAETLAFDFGDIDADDVEIRTSWRRLVDQTLPRAADQNPDWPVYLNHCFARILLDNAVGQFWRDVIPSPAWKNTPLLVLQTAIDLGEDILRDDADIWALNDASLIMRGKSPRGQVAATRGRRRRFKSASKYP